MSELLASRIHSARLAVTCCQRTSRLTAQKDVIQAKHGKLHKSVRELCAICRGVFVRSERI